jgi:hypothetical protein
MFHRRAFDKRGNAARRPVFFARRLAALLPLPDMPIKRELYEKMIEERIAAEEQSRREERRYWIITLLVCMLWCVFGAFITGLGFALVLDRETAEELILAGQGIAAGGVLLTVSYAGYLRQKRGVE